MNTTNQNTVFAQVADLGLFSLVPSANFARKNGRLPIFYSTIQRAQLMRALALYASGAYSAKLRAFDKQENAVTSPENTSKLEVFLIHKDNSALNRAVVFCENAEGQVEIQTCYANSIFNLFGKEVGMTVGAPHPISEKLCKDTASFNSWAQGKNQERAEKPINLIYAVQDKYVLLAAILSGMGIAFVSNAKTPESRKRFLAMFLKDGRPFDSQLRFLLSGNPDDVNAEV